MAPSHVFLLTGIKRSGKDTAAQAMREVCRDNGKAVRVLTFAGPLKNAAADILTLVYGRAFTVDEIDRSKNENVSVYSQPIAVAAPLIGVVTVLLLLGWSFWSVLLVCGLLGGCMFMSVARVNARRYLQQLGTDILRKHFYDDLFVDIVVRKIAAATEDVVIVTDCRFNNEAIRVLESFIAANVHVVEIERPGLTRDGHASEAGLDPKYISESIKNDGTLEFFENTVRIMMHDKLNPAVRDDKKVRQTEEWRPSDARH